MLKLWFRLRFFFRRKYKPIFIPPTKRDELVTLAELALKAVETLGYKLQDARAEGLLSYENRLGHPATDLYPTLAFQASRIRDELVVEKARDGAVKLSAEDRKLIQLQRKAKQ